MKHTPGPWKYEDSTQTIRGVPNNYWLATMNSWDGAVNHEANAQLIAAAPEQHEALKPFAAFAKAWQAQPLAGMDDVIYSIHLGTKHEATIRLSDCIKAAEAIAKAEGEESS